ncbi:MAG: hypothetical protein KIT47_01705 [Rhodoferax sp.]|nr:hypothetical protein [Rhodoferax sp.]
MTGFLHRLAQRANGTAPLVRSAAATRTPAGLPHAMAWPQAEASEHAGAADPMAYPSRPADGRGAAPGLPFGERHGPDARAARAPASTASPPPPAAAPQVPPARPVTTDSDTGPLATQHAPDPLQAFMATPPVTATAPSSRGPETQEARRPGSHRDTQPPAGPAVSHARVAHDARPAHDPIEAARQHLLAPQRVRAPAMPSQPRGRDRPAAAEEATEVHVHIGRIEVTALQPAPAPRKPARSGRAPLSLDDYLSRRRGAS